MKTATILVAAVAVFAAFYANTCVSGALFGLGSGINLVSGLVKGANTAANGAVEGANTTANGALEGLTEIAKSVLLAVNQTGELLRVNASVQENVGLGDGSA